MGGRASSTAPLDVNDLRVVTANLYALGTVCVHRVASASSLLVGPSCVFIDV